MTPAAAIHPMHATGVALVDAPEYLTSLRDPDCAAAIWQRQVLPDFGEWVEGLDPANLPRGRVLLRPAAVRQAVADLCRAAGLPDSTHRARLVDDIAAMADIFAQLMGVSWLRLRLDVVDTDACRKFHLDAVTARLVCTYRGTGTQYGNADRGSEPQNVYTVATGSAILLRGTLWPSKVPLLHRSPPIAGTGETRLVLVLDPIEDPENAI